MQQIRFIVGLMCSIALLAATALAQTETTAASPVKTPAIAAASEEAISTPGEITVGFRAGNDVLEGFTDLLAPLWRPDDGMFFINPRFSANDSSQEEYNLGLGYRQLFPKAGVIVGVNAYFDHRETDMGSQFNQVGAGLEILSKYLDFRANYYRPDDKQNTVSSCQTTETTKKSSTATQGTTEPVATGHTIQQNYLSVTRITTTTTTKLWEQYEQALEGFDLELGGHLPIPGLSDYMDVGIFGGYYFYNGLYNLDDIEGFKGRLEVELLPSLTLDAEVYEDDDLFGSDYFVGARISLPFDTSLLAQGRNPFKGAADGFKWRKRNADLSSRLGEMVMRDLHVRTDLSDVTEVKDAEQVTSSTATRSTEINNTLLANANFVDADNTSGVEDGTAEHPYNTVQEAVNNGNGFTAAYVWDAGTTYKENVVLKTSFSLYGSGYLLQGVEGKTFGSGIYPVIDGMNNGAAITLANNTTVAGVKVQNTAAPLAKRNKGGPDFDLERVGIYGNNVNNVILTSVQAEGCSIGAFIYNTEGNFNVAISDSTFKNNSQAGLGLIGGELKPVPDDTFKNNSLAGLALIGAKMVTVALPDPIDSMNVTLSGNTFTGNGETGLGIYGHTSGDATLFMENNTIYDNAGFGATIRFMTGEDTLTVNPIAGGNITMTLNNNVFTDNDGMGLGISANADGSATLTMTLNKANRNKGDGVCAELDAVSGDAVITIKDLQVNDNIAKVDLHQAVPYTDVGDGLYVEAYSHQGNSIGTFENIQANRNSHTGLEVCDIGTEGEGSSDVKASASFKNIEANNNGDFGLDIGVYATGAGTAAVTFDGITANNNSEEGLYLGWLNGADGADLVVKNVVANGNQGNDLDGCGVDLYNISAAGPVNVTIENVQADNNQEYGIFIKGDSSGGFNVTVDGVTANGNGDDGIVCDIDTEDGNAAITMQDSTAKDNSANGASFDLYSKNGTDTLRVEGSTFSGNTYHGIDINATGADQDLNLGDATAGTAGNNRIFGNTLGAVNNLSAATVMAENNWWGTATPGAGLFTGPVDYTPALATDPAP